MRNGRGWWIHWLLCLVVLRGSVAVEAARVFVVFQGEPMVSATGRLAAPAALDSERVRMASDQAVLAEWVAATGGRVIQTYTLLNHAAFVEVPDGAVAGLQAVPGVRSIVPERLHARRLDTSVAAVGARQVWRGVGGRTGRGVRVGVIDSGIDYLHAQFGGAGSKAGFLNNDPTVIELGSFPTARVVGGTDLVGDDYDAATGGSPNPDPDPLDPASNGHGTHVAGIAAGGGVTRDGVAWKGPYGSEVDSVAWRVAPGVAPEASLYAIKVFGGGGLTSSSIVVQALNWAADPNQDGNTSDRLDVVNLSLGSSFGEDGDGDPEVAAVERLTRLGCVVVMSAGNGGNASFKLDSPGTAPSGITVANSYDAGYSTGAVSVESPASVAGLMPAVEASFTPALAGMTTVRARVVLADPNLGCDPLRNAAALSGRIAMVDRGVCFFVDKVKALQDAGAVAVVVVNNVDGPPAGMAGLGDVSTIRIPAVMISKADGERLKPWLGLGNGVTLALSASVVIPFPELADTLAESSSRGLVWPSFRLKPDLSAPGSGILSAKAGSGADPVAETGTSMSAPHVAGAAALMRQARPGWAVGEIKAALMNTAAGPMRATNGAAYPESRVGAGRLAVDAAMRTTVIVRGESNPGAVSLSFGPILASSTVTRTQSVRVVNLGTTAASFRVVSSNTLDQPGVRLLPQVRGVTVAAGGSVAVPVVLEVDPRRLVPDADGSSSREYLGSPRHGLPEASGQLWFLGGNVDLHVPWHCAPRAVDGRRTGAALAGVPAGDPVTLPVPVEGDAVHSRPLVGLFVSGFRDASAGFTDSRSWTDIVGAGAMGDFIRVGRIEDTRLYFAVVTAGVRPGPLRGFVSIDVEIDRDSNGSVDVILANGNTGTLQADDLEDQDVANDAWVTAVDQRSSAPLFPGGTWNAIRPGTEDPAAFLNGVAVLTARAADLGLTAARPGFRYRVVTRGAFADQTPWIRFEPTRMVVDSTAHGIDGGPWQRADGLPLVTVRRSQAVLAGFTANGRIPLLVVPLHNQPGSQALSMDLDLARSDTDGDGLSDDWELANLRDLVGTRTSDRDGDGQNEEAERIAGTDPRNAQSVLRLGVSGAPGFPLKWSSVAGRRYTILRSRRIDGPWEVWRSGIPATPGANVHPDSSLTSDAQPWYYRLAVE